jgi:hypothetical protein
MATAKSKEDLRRYVETALEKFERKVHCLFHYYNSAFEITLVASYQI